LISLRGTQDPFGNYVVQYVLELGHPEASAQIMQQLFGHYAELAQQKFSSNVVEKCLKLGGPGLNECREAVIRELMASPQMGRMLQVRASPPRCALVPNFVF
jgi:Pumilio-family RNA binding repeat